MKTMQIKEVENKNDIIAFHQLPFAIYNGDENWVPQTRQELLRGTRCSPNLS